MNTAKALKFLESYGNRQTKLWKVLSKYDREYSTINKLHYTLPKNIENLQNAINLQQTSTTSLCSQANSHLYKTGSGRHRFKFIPYIPILKQTQYSLMHWNMILRKMVKQIYCWTYSHKRHHMPKTLEHMPRTLKKIQPQSLPIPKNTQCFHRIPIGLNLIHLILLYFNMQLQNVITGRTFVYTRGGSARQIHMHIYGPTSLLVIAHSLTFQKLFIGTKT